MRMIDSYQDMADTFLNGSFSMQKWEQYATRISQSLVEKVKLDSSGYHYETEILPVITHLFENPQKAEQAHHSFLQAVEKLPQKVLEVFGEEPDFSIYFYLGLCNGAGWATNIHGQLAILLGIEKIVELDWCDEQSMASLLYHEFGHLWHDSNRTVATELKTVKQKALWQLYAEGMATYCEQLLYGDFNFYHQDQDGWLQWCQSNRNRLAQAYLRRIDSGENTKVFFGDWNQWEGKSDTGYFLGAELV